MGFDGCSVVVEFIEIRFDNVNGSRYLSSRKGVDDNRGFVAIEKRIKEVHAANTEVDDTHTRPHDALRQPPRHFASETVIAEEDVPNPGYQNHWINSTSSAVKKNR